MQGVGFRPFVYCLALELGLAGWVKNSSDGLIVEVEGTAEQVEEFVDRLRRDKPAAAMIGDLTARPAAPQNSTGFEIRASEVFEHRSAGIQADLATCPDCLGELFDPTNRRYLYPFINCTHCGPRYTIVEEIPYDRPNTTMSGFALCEDCRREYEDPSNRRFHAQPNACPACGPALSAPVWKAAEVLARGEILALKGVGGFQLLVDARNESAVEQLRARKRRDEKPFAMMMASIEMIRGYCQVSAAEEDLLRSPAAPIVLLRPNGIEGIAWGVAKSSPWFGVMLPYSPLHHLLARSFPFPIVATSGNLSEEPIAIDNEEALSKLEGIAAGFLLHDRDIARACDDSVARVVAGRASVVRRARGYAPLPVFVKHKLPAVLAVGGHLKNTVAIAVGDQVIVSQHIGDLDTVEARAAFEAAIGDLCRLYRFEPKVVACDFHPDYASTRWARECGLRVIPVQHHQAHVSACAAENHIEGRYLGVAWDGAGYGEDGVIWGSEMFLVEGAKLERIGHLRPFRLPGGDAAARDCRRPADSVRVEAGLPAESPVFGRMVERGVNAPLTTSMGRLFDAVASITGIAHENRFEGQAAMMLERSAAGVSDENNYLLPVDGAEADWRPMIRAVAEDAGCGVSPAVIAARFHNTLAQWIAETAQCRGIPQVVLSGGVLQNQYLTERVTDRLQSQGVQVFTHHLVPANDGGLALGQAVLASAVWEGL